MVSFLHSLVFLLVVSGVVHTHALSDPELDLNRDADFLRSEFVPGVTYVSTSSVETTTHVVNSGAPEGAELPSLDQQMHIEMGNRLDVTELPQGGKEIDMEYSRVGMTMEIAGQTLTYDSEGKKDPKSPLAPIVDAMLESKITLVLDDENNVVESNNPMTEKLASIGSKDLQDGAKQFDQMTRITKALPEEPVMPGDTWDYTMDAEIVSFTGTGTLLGYVNYEGHDCAVVVLEGEVDMDIDEMAELIESSTVASAMAGMTVSDGKMTVTMYFDPKNELARWMENTTTMTMDLPSPFDPSKSMSMEVTSVAKNTVDTEE